MTKLYSIISYLFLSHSATYLSLQFLYQGFFYHSYYSIAVVMSDCTRDQLLESLCIYAIALLFNKTMEDLVDSSSSSSSSLLSSSFFSSDEETTEILDIIDVVSSTCYLEYCQLFGKSDAILDLCLNVYKLTQPKEFWVYTQMSSDAFDLLVQTLEIQPIFDKNSINSQISVDQQVLITLIRLENYRNGASLNKIVGLYGVVHGTVDLITRRVIKAIQSSNMRSRHI